MAHTVMHLKDMAKTSIFITLIGSLQVQCLLVKMPSMTGPNGNMFPLGHCFPWNQSLNVSVIPSNP